MAQSSSPTNRIVLLLTHRNDHYTVDRVADCVTRHNFQPVRFNTDEYPLGAGVSMCFSDEEAHHRIRLDGRIINTADVHAVWLRKFTPPRLDESLDARFRDYCAQECRAALRGLFDSLPAARWLDRPEAAQRAENKPYQLAVARRCGLAIPRTLITNEPQDVADMYRDLDGAMVAKMLTPHATETDDGGRYVYTTEIEEADLAHLESLRHCPMIFQQRIEKAYELRIACVNGACFAGRVDASNSEHGKTDWRLVSTDECSWSRAELPEHVSEGIGRLMAALNLSFGAIDMIVTLDGEYVFLEVNPGGEWGMLERDLGLPIAEAIAEALTEKR